MRDRNENGRYRQKRGDTHVGTIEQKYGIELNVRSDMHLDTLRKRVGNKSMTQIVKGHRQK